jgi:hypothetical protein
MVAAVPTRGVVFGNVANYLALRIEKSHRSDIRFYWIQDHTLQKQFLVFWQPGSTHLGDYRTKHHSRPITVPSDQPSCITPNV